MKETIISIIGLLLMLIGIGFMANGLVNQIEKEGLKSIVDEVWHGKSEQAE